MTTAVVLTTISLPKLLVEFVEDMAAFDHFEDFIIVIGDLKTPEGSVNRFVNELSQIGISVQFWNVRVQKKWLKNFPTLERMVPYNSDNRRNVGFLAAAQMGAESIVSLDDDNFLYTKDFIGHHSIVGKQKSLPTPTTSNNWFNPCSMLRTNLQIEIYSRGFPFSKRFPQTIHWKKESGKIALNMGLWLGHPDVDAVTNLVVPAKSVALKRKRILIPSGTFVPINSQNTCFDSRVLPCFYYIPMDANISGMKLERYGDIWCGYFAKKVLDRIGDRVSIGLPLTYHRRNPHNLLNDLSLELWGMIMTEDIIQALEQINLSSRTYSDAYIELAHQLKSKVRSPHNAFNKYLDRLSSCMVNWVEICDEIL